MPVQIQLKKKKIKSGKLKIFSLLLFGVKDTIKVKMPACRQTGL
jgi:hypothetical protein